ncbi:MAG: AAA family ATPase, partial [Rikenellaceae bacterium]
METAEIIVDNVKLDLSNEKFFKAADIVLNTDVSVIYLTGKAGTGKSIFVKYIREIYDKTVITLAPTGVAAVNVKGQTIHSFFPLDFSVYGPDDDRLSNQQISSNLRLNNNKIELIKNINMIIIDEVSMVRCDILDCIDRILRYYRVDNRPFGGVKMLLVGDTFQLPPVVKSQEKQILDRHCYKSEFFFDSRVYQMCSPFYIQLDKVYRQEEDLFLSILEKVRIGDVTEQELKILNENSSNIINENSILLSSMVAPAENYNARMLEAIDSEIITFDAKIEGNFPNVLKPVESSLKLKMGAQVMIMKNKFEKNGEAVYYNGQIGIISKIGEDNIVVKCNDKSIYIYKATWENNRYSSFASTSGNF